MIPHDPLPFPFPFPFRRTRVLFAAAFLAAAGCASRHQKLSPENVPAPVRAAVAQRFPGARSRASSGRRSTDGSSTTTS